MSGTGHRLGELQGYPSGFPIPAAAGTGQSGLRPLPRRADARMSSRPGFHLALSPSRSGVRCRGTGLPAAPGVAGVVAGYGRACPRPAGPDLDVAGRGGVAVTRVVLRCPASPGRIGSLRTRAESGSRWRWRSSALTVCRSPSIGRCWPIPTPTSTSWPGSSTLPGADVNQALKRLVELSLVAERSPGRIYAPINPDVALDALLSLEQAELSRRERQLLEARAELSRLVRSGDAGPRPYARRAGSTAGSASSRCCRSCPPAATRRRSTSCPAAPVPPQLLAEAAEHDLAVLNRGVALRHALHPRSSSRTSRCATTCT